VFEYEREEKDIVCLPGQHLPFFFGGRSDEAFGRRGWA
jgi:hypothetical protein